MTECIGFSSQECHLCPMVHTDKIGCFEGYLGGDLHAVLYCIVLYYEALY